MTTTRRVHFAAALVALASAPALVTACHDSSSSASAEPAPSENASGAVAPDGAPAASASPSSSASSSSAPTPPANVAPVLAPVLQMYSSSPGLGAIVVRDDGTVLALGVTGARKSGDPTPLTTSDRFFLNADVAAMTATLAALLVQDGKIDWDTTLSDALVGVAMSTSYASTTLKDLLAQRAGAPAAIPTNDETNARAASDPAAARAATVRDLLALGATGTTGKYTQSAASVLLANAMLEAASGQSWETVIATRLFAPLGMTSCASVASDPGAAPSMPWGHTVASDGTVVPTAPGGAGEPPAAYAPASGLRCTLADWGRFVAMHLAAARGTATANATAANATSLLTASSFATLQTPIGFSHAPAWNVVSRAWAGAQPALNARGDGPSSFALTWLLPDKNAAIVVLVNEGGADAARVANRTVARLVGTIVNGPTNDAGVSP